MAAASGVQLGLPLFLAAAGRGPFDLPFGIGLLAVSLGLLLLVWRSASRLGSATAERAHADVESSSRARLVGQARSTSEAKFRAVFEHAAIGMARVAKFTPRGGRVSVSLSSDESTATIIVRDDGVGIAPHLLEKLFEPFTQADATLDRSKGGLGLGLALVKGLVDLHGGTVCVRSEGLGTGAEVTVKLPLA